MADDAKLQEIQKLGGTAIKPVGWDRTGWEAFQYMLWNPDTGEILTRTPLSWLKITVFYCIYYCCLAGFWIACLNVFFATLPEAHDGPRWLKEDSIIGVNPGRQSNRSPPPSLATVSAGRSRNRQGNWCSKLTTIRFSIACAPSYAQGVALP